VRIQIEPDNRLLTPAEVAAMLRVDPKTVTRWARAGKLSSIRTPGGHRLAVTEGIASPKSAGS